MRQNSELYEAIYVSTMASGLPITTVAAISSHSRLSNQEKNITGLLIFDGIRFCQQLEGAQEEVLRLVKTIQDDSRHTNMTVIHQGAFSTRRFGSFNMGYTTVDDPDALARLEKLKGKAAVDAFVALLSELDCA